MSSDAARAAADRELAATAGVERGAAYDRICAAVRGLTPVVPELIEAVDGTRRVYWPATAKRREPDPGLFSR